MSGIKRMRYFREEFLKNEDFIDEQDYHRRMRYRHNKDFHTWGIGDGLGVTFTPGEHRVDISPGIAIDGEGKEIVLEEPRILDFSKAGYEGGKSYYITITWSQEEGDPRQENEAKRWVERPEINTTGTLPAQQELALVLAQVTLNPDRTIAVVDDSGCHYAQIGIPDGSVDEAKLADNAVTSAKIKDGSVNEEKLSTSIKAKLVTNGDAHTHSAQDVGALPKTGGTIDGNLQVKGDVNITNVIDFGDTTDWNDHWRFTHQWITPGDLVIDRRVAGTYVGPYLTITTSGRVGIGPGAGTPEETLHVNGSVRGNQQGGALRINTTNGYVDIGSQDQNNTHFMTDRETFYFNKRIMVDGGEIGSSSEQDMKLQTGGETRVKIKQDNGNVGIGTINPNEKLTVEGAISLKEQDISPSAEKGYGKIYAKEHTLFCTKFNGVDYYVSMSSLNKNNIADFTISLWFKMNAHNPKGRSYLLDLRGDGSEVRMAGGLIIDDAGGGNSYLEHYWCWASGGYSEFRENIGNITGSWHHTVLVREGNVLREYLDGTLISDNPTQGSSVLPKDDLVTFDNEWRIGTSASQNTAGDNYWFNGFIDEVSIWDRALSTEEISSIFIGSRSIDLTQVYSSNLIGYWRMGDGDTFPTIEDHSGNNNNGTVQSGEFDSTTIRALYYKDSHGNELPLSGVKGVGGGISSLWSQMGSNIYYDRGNVGIGDLPKVDAKLYVAEGDIELSKGDIRISGSLNTQGGQVRRDFLTWYTTEDNAYPVHIKTNIKRESNTMYRFLVEGYNWVTACAINSDVVGYAYVDNPTMIHTQSNNYANGVGISQYYSSDGYVVVKLSISRSLCMGFSVSAWFTNPYGNAFDVSAVVYHQPEDL